MLVTTEQASTVRVHDLGGSGPPLLIGHATGFHGRAYAPLAELLGAHHHVWGIDLRGHGDSPPPPDGDFDWHGIVFDVLAAAAAIADASAGDGPVHFVGHSMGGAVGLQAEAVRAGTFATMFLYEPIVVPAGVTVRHPPDRGSLIDGARKRNEVFGSREAAMWRYASKRPLSGLGAGSLAAYVEHGFEDQPDGTVRLKCRAESEARTFENSGSVTTGTIGGAQLPLTVATGSPAQSNLAGLGPHIVAAVPDSELLVYEHLGHFGPFQDLHRIAADVLRRTMAASNV
jgi:pimeloyl-ACP methyl ester carboxylesterase